MNLIYDINFIFVGISLIGMGILGFIVYTNDSKNDTNKTFLFLTLSAILWGIFNYLYNLPSNNKFIILWFLRIHLFFAVLYSFFIFHFLYVFPEKKHYLSKYYKFIFIPFVLLIGLITLTPLTFRNIELNNFNRIEKVDTDIGIIIFGCFVLFMLFYGFIRFFLKTITEKISFNEKLSRFLILLGVMIFISLNLIFNFIFPNFFQNSKYVILGASFTFPFIIISSYVILKYKFLNVKFIITDLFIFIILIISAIQILRSQSFLDTIIRLVLFIGVFILSIFLIRVVRKEVEQAEQLRKLNEELDRANKLKSEFLSFASHQLKSPMAVIKGYVSLMIDGTIPNVPDQVKDFAIKIKKSIDDLLILIEEFMDYRRIDENRMEFNFEKVEITDFIKNIFDNYIVLAKERNLEFSLENNLEPTMVNIDKIRFAQVIQNLIDNALKYTKQGFIKIFLTKKDSNILICVRDSGIGMSKDLQVKLFGQFIRDPSIKKEIQGTGLGLYIAKYIIENHKGKIWAESDGEGKGSQFCIEIPIL
ncbi:MAG: ATP-binding protein [Patescibacteria group bacterium]|nr:ATP-binding protein [Patescibacteria group bacterium]MDW8279682.1 ATP-binding protein [bacterium]